MSLLPTLLAVLLSEAVHSTTAALPLTSATLTSSSFVVCSDDAAASVACDSSFAPVLHFYADGLATSELFELNGCWQILDADSLLVNGLRFHRATASGSFFHANVGADPSFGLHILLRTDADRWSAYSDVRLTSPAVLQALRHDLLVPGVGVHDTCIALAQDSSSDDVPYLLLALPERSQIPAGSPSRLGFPCTVWHCRDALVSATGLDFGLFSDDWYVGLGLTFPTEPFRPRTP